MKMSSSNDWNKRPLAKEEINTTQSVSTRFVATIFAIVLMASIIAFGVMIIIQIFHEANALDWSLSYRDSQLVTVIALIIRGLLRSRDE
jgi:hypothetical protein